MIPKGDAGSDEFTMVVDAAQTRAEANKNENENENEESIKKAA
jgi:subtilase family serine protease